MSTARTLTVTAVTAGALLAGAAAVAHAAPTSGAATSTGSGLVSATAGPELARDLAFSRDEERMARDLYAALAARWDGARPMSMITRSEQRHVDAVGTLLTRYAVADPASGRAAGSYADPALQGLYDGWLAKGSTSLNAAYQVGIELEKRDIADLEKTIAATSETDVRTVLGALLAGSRNHLRAYENAAAGTPVTQGRQRGQGMQQGPGLPGRQQGQGMRQGRGVPGPGPGMQGQRNGRGPGAGAGQCPMTGTPRTS